jgi:hypothetical protein
MHHTARQGGVLRTLTEQTARSRLRGRHGRWVIGIAPEWAISGRQKIVTEVTGVDPGIPVGNPLEGLSLR